MPDKHFDAPEISPFKRDPLNPFYLLAKLVYTSPGYNTYVRKKIALEIISIFQDEYHVSMNENVDIHDLLRIINGYHNVLGKDGIEYYEVCIKSVLLCLGIDLENEKELKNTFESFLDKTKERIKRYKIENTNLSIKSSFYEKRGIVLSTIHGVKGEEYNTVIAFALLNGYLPHWDYIYKDEKKAIRNIETKKLLYVLASRAKKNLYLFSESGRVTQKGYPYMPTDELEKISFDYDT